MALTDNVERNGGLHVWPLGGAGPRPVEFEAGDVLVMDSQLPHASGFARTGLPRYCVYFRFLAP